MQEKILAVNNGNKKMKTPIITAISYEVPLTINQFKKLDKRDFSEDVMPKLEKVGAHDIEYNGHFGASIFFTMYTKYNNNLDDVLAVIKKLVK